MKLNEVIDAINKDKLYKILVTGPQRSGTTIASKILADELGYRCIDEMRGSSIQDILHFINHATRFVFQGPTLSAYCHLLPITVVYMMRQIDEIIASEIRIGWSCEKIELNNYFTDKGPISKVKYDAWLTYQRPFTKSAFELEYHSMENHHLWIDKEKRVNFGAKQTVLMDKSNEENDELKKKLLDNRPSRFNWS